MGVRSIMKVRARKHAVVCQRYPMRKHFKTKEACGAAAVRIANTQKVFKLPEACSACNGWHLADAK